ncbi:MAG TPA: hypothetical protein VGF77_09775 [Allosphingosinicella sp.]|jgi:hypothetical protein
MDAAVPNHYVAKGALGVSAARRISRVQLLLFVSAMLASLTGFVSGDRAVEPRHVEQAVVAASALMDAAPAATRKAEAALPLAAPAAIAPAVLGAFHIAAAPILPGRAPVDERRLE